MVVAVVAVAVVAEAVAVAVVVAHSLSLRNGNITSLRGEKGRAGEERKSKWFPHAGVVVVDRYSGSRAVVAYNGSGVKCFSRQQMVLS